MREEILPGVVQAGALLRLLLEKTGTYRSEWERKARQLRGTQINNDAVARVLARQKERDDPAGIDHRSLTETVRQALKGKRLSAGTLNLFIEAFRMSEQDAERLWALARGSDRIKVVSGDALPPHGLYEKIGPIRHQTITLHELHRIGPDRLPAEHRTIHTLKAIVEGLEYYPYTFDTSAATVSVERNGKPGKIYRVSAGFFAVNIVFDRPLCLGETATFEYTTSFNYNRLPPPEFRRGAFRQVDSLLMEVRFDPQAVPQKIWWAEWSTLDHTAVKQREEVHLNSELAVHCHHERVQGAIVGFYWEW